LSGDRLPPKLESAWQTELNAQFYRGAEIVLLMRATAWIPDFALGYMSASWETAWFPTEIEGIPDRPLAMVAGLAAVAHAVHAGIGPAALLPMEAKGNDPFVMALRRIELQNGRLLQAQILFLKGPELMPFRSTVSSALERRHMEIGKLGPKRSKASVSPSVKAISQKALMQIKCAPDGPGQYPLTSALSLIAC
jgi:hypothetical protein